MSDDLSVRLSRAQSMSTARGDPNPIPAYSSMEGAMPKLYVFLSCQHSLVLSVYIYIWSVLSQDLHPGLASMLDS